MDLTKEKIKTLHKSRSLTSIVYNFAVFRNFLLPVLVVHDVVTQHLHYHYNNHKNNKNNNNYINNEAFQKQSSKNRRTRKSRTNENKMTSF